MSGQHVTATGPGPAACGLSGTSLGGPETPPKDNKEDVTILPKPPVMDNVWYTQEVIYQDGLVVVKLDGKMMFEYRLSRCGHQAQDSQQHGDLVATGHLRPSGTPADAGAYQARHALRISASRSCASSPGNRLVEPDVLSKDLAV